jgi:DNA-binding CsgD family transcriptional regulator
MLSPSVTRTLLSRLGNDEMTDRRRFAAQRLSSLTDSEREVATAVGSGASNAEVAASLFMSEPTVKAHVSRLLTKLAVTNRVHIAILVHDAQRDLTAISLSAFPGGLARVARPSPLICRSVLADPLLMVQAVRCRRAWLAEQRDARLATHHLSDRHPFDSGGHGRPLPVPRSPRRWGAEKPINDPDRSARR